MAALLALLEEHIDLEALRAVAARAARPGRVVVGVVGGGAHERHAPHEHVRVGAAVGAVGWRAEPVRAVGGGQRDG